MELTSCACVCVPVACEKPLRMFDFVFPCVRVAVQPYIGFTVGMVVSRCWCIDLDPSLLRVVLLFVLQTSHLAFSRRLLCPFVLGALNQRCPRNVPSSVCVCVFWLVCGDVSVSELTSLRCLVRVQLRLWVCWDKGVSYGVHATLLKHLCSRKWSSAFLHDGSEPTVSDTSVHEHVIWTASHQY